MEEVWRWEGCGVRVPGGGELGLSVDEAVETRCANGEGGWPLPGVGTQVGCGLIASKHQPSETGPELEDPGSLPGAPPQTQRSHSVWIMWGDRTKPPSHGRGFRRVNPAFLLLLFCSLSYLVTSGKERPLSELRL